MTFFSANGKAIFKEGDRVGWNLTGLEGFSRQPPKIPILGKLPGDIYIKRENFSFYFPITTCILLSFLLSLILMIFKK
jgi:hypothetical protein